MKRTNTSHISDILQVFYDDNPDVKQKLLESRVIRAWNEMFSASVLQCTRTLYIKSGVLHVSVNSAALRSELTINRNTLKNKLNETAGGDVISDIMIR
ncbi:MAG: DUF721 domain-containing protein [Tannerella sp.]|jgi:predicted nucleic acid-binding Zn ribbon protein|nr:DUF721 domain-containing protein [Tannerella sp.]